MENGVQPAARNLCGGRQTLITAVMLLVLLAGSARQVLAQAVKGTVVSVGIGGMEGTRAVYREGSWIPVQVKLQNMTPVPLVGHLGVQQLDLDGDKVMSIGPEFVLPPGVEARTLWTYYWPRTDMSVDEYGITSVLVLDKSGTQVLAKVTTPNELGNSEPITPARDPDKESRVPRSSRFVIVLGDDWAGWNCFGAMLGGTESVKPVLVGPMQLPDDVRGLDGVDVIVWEADRVKVSDVPPEFQLKAMLEWVRSGGHLVISVGTQGQEFLKAGTGLLDALPMTITGTRAVNTKDFSGGSNGRNWRMWEASRDVVQVTGEIKPGARAVGELSKGVFAAHPLAVTGLYGRGAITLVTMNVADATIRMPQLSWISFWNQAAGWQNGNFYSRDELAEMKKGQPQLFSDLQTTMPRELQLGKGISEGVDVKDITGVRVLVAFFFLAFYWLVAGPVGHLVLRQYKVVHWSWWIFGGTVLAAIVVAATVVGVLHVNAYDVRHRTFVLGTVNSNEVTVSSYYGVYAPLSGPVSVKMNGITSSGINYLAPLCVPTLSPAQSFADPQSYVLHVNLPAEIAPVFRNTLKKLQGRSTLNMPGLSGSAEYLPGTNPAKLVKGKLVNNSGYDLDQALIAVYLPGIDKTYLFHVKSLPWKSGQAIDLDTQIELDELGMRSEVGSGREPGSVELLLRAMGHVYSSEPPYQIHGMSVDTRSNQIKDLERRISNSNEKWNDDLLYTLLDRRQLDELSSEHLVEPQRGIGRLTDCSKALRAAGGMVVAHAGNSAGKQYVKSPVTLNVNGKDVEGKGEVTFAWTLPIAGEPPAARYVPATATAPAGGGAGGRGGRGNPGGLVPSRGPEAP